MRRTNQTFLLLGVLVLMGSCGKCGSGAADAPRDPDPETPIQIRSLPMERKHTVFQKPPELPQQRAVELDDPGAAPRRMLRYQPDEAAREATIAGRVKSRELQNGEWTEPMELPEIRYGLGLISAGKDGDELRVDVRGLRPEVADIPANVDAAVRERMTSAIEQSLTRYRKHVERRRASLRVSERGLMGELTLTPDSATSSEASHVRHEILQLLIESVVPLPEAPVGPGARWRATTLMRRGPAVVTQRAEYELLAVDGDRLRIRASLEQIGQHQIIPEPSLPASVIAELVALFWHASGELEVSLASLTPLAGTLEVEMRVHGRLVTPRGNQDDYLESTATVSLTTR